MNWRGLTRAVVVAVVAAGVAGCAGRSPVEGGVDVEKVVERALGGGAVRVACGFRASGRRLGEFPVRRPAKVLKAWVPAHRSPSGRSAVLGHWVVVVVRPEEFDLPAIVPERKGAAVRGPWVGWRGTGLDVERLRKIVREARK